MSRGNPLSLHPPQSPVSSLAGYAFAKMTEKKAGIKEKKRRRALVSVLTEIKLSQGEE